MDVTVTSLPERWGSQMKTTKINFEKMYGGFLKEDNLITNTLRLRYNVVIDESNPDVIFCQDFPGDPAAPVTASRLGRSKIVHWFIDNRKIRLEKGQNIFRYYWYLWLLSPAILILLLLILAFTTGVLEGWKELG